jgi:DNA-binding response OmpR family regulator
VGLAALGEAIGACALKGLLEADGYAVDQAADGAAALERLVELPPDVIVTDLDMPVMSGLELLTALRERGQDVPVIVVTSATGLNTAIEAIRSGATDYLTQPVAFDALSLSIERLARQVANSRATVLITGDGQGRR